jgi:hypothetical protein
MFGWALLGYARAFAEKGDGPLVVFGHLDC